MHAQITPGLMNFMECAPEPFLFYSAAKFSCRPSQSRPSFEEGPKVGFQRNTNCVGRRCIVWWSGVQIALAQQTCVHRRICLGVGGSQSCLSHRLIEPRKADAGRDQRKSGGDDERNGGRALRHAREQQRHDGGPRAWPSRRALPNMPLAPPLRSRGAAPIIARLLGD